MSQILVNREKTEISEEVDELYRHLKNGVSAYCVLYNSINTNELQIMVLKLRVLGELCHKLVDTCVDHGRELKGRIRNLASQRDVCVARALSCTNSPSPTLEATTKEEASAKLCETI